MSTNAIGTLLRISVITLLLLMAWFVPTSLIAIIGAYILDIEIDLISIIYLFIVVLIVRLSYTKIFLR
jgi:hypothetical protein